MDNIAVWYYGLPIFAKYIVLFISSIIAFFIIGFFVLLQEGPQDKDFWGSDDPTIWRLIVCTIFLGFIICFVLGLIFGLVFLLYKILNWIGIKSVWFLIPIFVICLVGVLFGIYYLAERRVPKE